MSSRIFSLLEEMMHGTITHPLHRAPNSHCISSCTNSSMDSKYCPRCTPNALCPLSLTFTWSCHHNHLPTRSKCSQSCFVFSNQTIALGGRMESYSFSIAHAQCLARDSHMSRINGKVFIKNTPYTLCNSLQFASGIL